MSLAPAREGPSGRRLAGWRGESTRSEVEEITWLAIKFLIMSHKVCRTQDEAIKKTNMKHKKTHTQISKLSCFESDSKIVKTGNYQAGPGRRYASYQLGDMLA